MTDSELLDGLQRLFDRGVVVLRSCRSGVKIELNDGDFRYADEVPDGLLRNFREYFGTGATLTDGTPVPELGPNVRGVIERAIVSER